MRRLLAIGSLPLARLRQIVAVLVIAISALFGGLDQVHKDDGTVRLAAEQTYPGKQFHVTPHRARLVADAIGVPHPAPGQTVLALALRIENVSNEPAIGLGDIVRPVGVAGPKPRAQHVQLVRDRSYGPAAQPKLPDEYEIFWTVPDGVHASDKVTFRIVDSEYLADTKIGNGGTWLEIKKHGEVELTVQPMAAKSALAPKTSTGPRPPALGSTSAPTTKSPAAPTTPQAPKPLGR